MPAPPRESGMTTPPSPPSPPPSTPPTPPIPPPPPTPPPFRRHVLVCVGPSCTDRGSADVREALRCELLRRGLDREVRTTKCQCLDLCNHGPNVVVYPEGVWYEGVKPRDIPEIVERHLAGGTPVERLRHDWSRPEIADDETFLL